VICFYVLVWFLLGCIGVISLESIVNYFLLEEKEKQELNIYKYRILRLVYLSIDCTNFVWSLFGPVVFVAGLVSLIFFILRFLFLNLLNYLKFFEKIEKLINEKKH